MAKKSKAQAKKPAKAAKAPRVPKTKANAPGAAKVQAETKAMIGDNSLTDKERQELFLKDKAALAAAKGKLEKVVAEVRNVKKRIKADGFTVAQVEAAIEMETPEGEEKVKAKIEAQLEAARWVGVAWGSQLDLFLEPDRTPIADRAYKEGERASMENKPARPDYSPETEAYRRYMDGFHTHQAKIAKGFKAPKPDANGGGEKPEAVTSGERVTRSEFKQRLADTTAQETDGSPKVH